MGMMPLARRTEGHSTETKWRRLERRKECLKMANRNADHIAEAVDIVLESVPLLSRIRVRACLLDQSFTGEKSSVERRLMKKSYQLSSRPSGSYTPHTRCQHSSMYVVERALYLQALVSKDYERGLFFRICLLSCLFDVSVLDAFPSC